MKVKNECLVCLLNQILEIGKATSADQNKIKIMLDICAKKIPEINFTQTAPEIVEELYKQIKVELADNDPYSNFKKVHMNKARKVSSFARKVINQRQNKIETALLLAATGNALDAGISSDIDIETILKEDINQNFVINDIDKFKIKLSKTKKLLIIADNSGEGYFDKLLIEELNKNYEIEIYYAVRHEPILNDITLKEAEEIGLNEVVTVIDSGSKAPGLIIEETNEEFRDIFNKADIIISKGQGNYEALSEHDFSLFYLLKAKCEVIAREFDVDKGGLIFKYSSDK